MEANHGPVDGQLECAPREEGATSVEYAIMASLIAVVIVVAVTLIGESLVPIFATVADTLET